MLRRRLLVTAFSVILIALFCTFCYLITTVNPPRIKPDTYRARKFGVEDVLYPNYAPQSNDNVAYGLEKADYDVLKTHHTISTLTTAYRRAEIPRTTEKEKNELKLSKNYVTNCSTEEDGEPITTTQAMKLPVKGFRRSISEKAKVNDSNFLSLLFNLNKLDSQPRIEFEISNNKHPESLRRYKDEDKPKIKLNLTDFGYNNNKTIIELKENEILIVKYVGDSIEITHTKSNETMTKISYSEFENATDTCDEHGCVLNPLNNTVKNESPSGNLTLDFNTTLQTNSTDNTTFTHDLITPLYSFSAFKIENLTHLSIRINANEFHDSDKRQNSNDNVNDSLSTKELVGLLIPEAVATLPVN